MNCRAKTNRWILVVAACAVLATNASIAAEGAGKSAPNSGEAISHHEGSPAGSLPDPGAAANRAGADTVGHNSARAENRGDAGNLAARPSAASTASGRSSKGGAGETGTESGGKSAGRGIDLIRPDDGYAGLRRRATRSSLIVAGQTKKLLVVPPIVVTAHPASPAGPPVEARRNSAGVALPVGGGVGRPDSAHIIPLNTGLTKNSVGMGLGEIHRPEIHLTATGTMAPATGINGTTMGHARVGGIGGPAKNQSATNGSALRPRF
jgi:hypothetical protein